MHDDCNRRKSNDDGIDIGKDRWGGKINGCFINDEGSIRCELPLNIVRKRWSDAFCCIELIIKESFFGKSMFDDVVTETVGYSWTVSEIVDDEVFVERESERDEHRWCLLMTDFGVEDAVGANRLDDRDDWGLCHRRCEAKLAGQLNVLSHSGQLNEKKNKVTFQFYCFFLPKFNMHYSWTFMHC